MAQDPQNHMPGLRGGKESLFDRRLQELRSTGQIEKSAAPAKQTLKPHTHYETPSLDSQLLKTSEQAHIKELEHMALLDPLTEQYNNRTILNKLKIETTRSNRYKQALSLLVFQIDGYDNLSTTVPAVALETLVREVSKTLSKNAREVDICGILDNQKFLVICPQTTLDQASVMAERVVSLIASTKITHIGHVFSITASAGICAFPEIAKSSDELLRMCLNSLKTAAEQGGNTVVGYTAQLTSTDFVDYLDKQIESSFGSTEEPYLMDNQTSVIQPSVIRTIDFKPISTVSKS